MRTQSHGLTSYSIRLQLFVLLLVIAFSSAVAHEIRPAIADLNYSNKSDTDADSQLLISLSLNLESLISEIGPEHDNTDTSENSDIYQNLREMEPDQLLTEFELFEAKFLSSLFIRSADGVVLPTGVSLTEIPPVGDINIPRDSNITLEVSLPRGVSAVSWQWTEAFGEVIVRGNSDIQEMDFAVLLSPGQQSDLIQFEQATTLTKRSVIANYIVVGFEHILPKGVDHILFVVGLFLLTPRWRPLAVQITLFTLAHSITLALGVSGLLRVSPSIVEPLIALSIVFVCVENFVTASLNKWRMAIVFGFGLLHGLGFASVLGEVGLATINFVAALFGFNIGVELGQLLVVGVCLFTVGVWFGDKWWYRSRISQPASVLIGLIGAYWFVQRTVLG